MRGKWTVELLDNLMHKSYAIKDIGERIDYLSRQFLNTPYKESSLTGSINVPEVYVINLEGMDCITFIEYIEAMRLSRSYNEFTENLRKVRYRNGEVTFEGRRHFFTNWVGYRPRTVEDLTAVIGGTRTVKIRKTLNLNKDGTQIVIGICPEETDVAFIRGDAIDDKVIEKLKTGDYAGIYSSRDGLDVSHTGIIIKDADKTYLRHASSRKEIYKVTDDELTNYLSGKNGLIILRPIELSK